MTISWLALHYTCIMTEQKLLIPVPTILAKHYKYYFGNIPFRSRLLAFIAYSYSCQLRLYPIY